jgi:hypothetical protein
VQSWLDFHEHCVQRLLFSFRKPLPRLHPSSCQVLFEA